MIEAGDHVHGSQHQVSASAALEGITADATLE
jgi:hypothetical protein